MNRPRRIGERVLLHADESLLIVNKPSGLLSQPGRGEHLRDSLITRLDQELGPLPGLVHRLDRDTSGLMVLPRTMEAHRHLSRQFHDRRVDKRYVSLVSGQVADDAGTIAAPLRKDMDRPPRHMVDHDLGREAITQFRVLERLNDRTRLEMTPITGRSHQLRVHLSHIGHPILGDPLYGDATSAPRLMLHATLLAFTHPRTNRRVSFQSPSPL